MNGRNDSIHNSLHRIFEVLKHHLRRDVIDMLVERPGEPVPIDEVVDYIARESEAARGLTREQILTQLRHVHLPKLVEHEVVEFEPQADVVRYRSDEEIEEMLSLVHDWKHG